ncbi:MAG TPA: 2-amino-4-hydroxy-6-hydroxymethyldihydropteridine diphosphokinase [Anaerolineae bacterium]|nr:2-amino-4-hydroxy-6-hydroxymethyldihydropteridine diphosphokinase [Anaerolineae bacterium]
MLRIGVGQRVYFLGVGSNIEPYVNSVAILEGLLGIAGEIYISRIVETAAVDIESDNRFLNFCVVVVTDWEEAVLRRYCQQIEVDLGRDRRDPTRKWRDRPADIDVLCGLGEVDGRLELGEMAEPFFVCEPMWELAERLDMICEGDGSLWGKRGSVLVTEGIGLAPMKLVQMRGGGWEAFDLD